MKRRWILRILFMLLLLLPTTAWGLSVVSETYLGYYYRDHGGGVVISNGYLKVIVGRVVGGTRKFYFWRHPINFYKEPTSTSEYHSVFLGFGYAHQAYKPDDILILAIPLWAPTTLFSLLLLYVWIKTRSLDTKRAFPVVMSET